MTSSAGGWKSFCSRPPLTGSLGNSACGQAQLQHPCSRRFFSLKQQQQRSLQPQERGHQQQRGPYMRLAGGSGKAGASVLSWPSTQRAEPQLKERLFYQTRGYASGKERTSAAPSPLSKNVEMKEILSPRWVLEPPNFLRRPLWRQWWEAQFANRSFFFFGNAWTSAAAFAAFLWWSRIFDPPPKERLDRYWLNSPKFRILSAFHNPGKRPALKISLMTYEARYCYRGLDHPFTLNELKDFLFKLREQHLVNYFHGVQFPFVFRQFNRVKTPATLEVQTSPVPQQLPHFHDNHGGEGHH